MSRIIRPGEPAALRAVDRRQDARGNRPLKARAWLDPHGIVQVRVALPQDRQYTVVTTRDPDVKGPER